ncbi:MAG: K(+)-transporting ATPase subunit F [Solirubrobacterales bacterium]
MDILALVVAGLLFAYLVFALLYPEKL